MCNSAIDVPEAGYKFHMNDVCAVVGNENFKHLPEILAKHRENAEFYNQAFLALLFGSANTVWERL